MANLSARRITFDTAIANLRQVVSDCTTDVNAGDSDRVAIQQLKTRALAALDALGIPHGPSHA